MNVKEKFVKVDGEIYGESELQKMNSIQLNSLIIKCQQGIEEIEKKKSDYEKVNDGLEVDEHYRTVISKFNSASVYLQSDIVLITKVLRERDGFGITKENWLEEFFTVAKNNLPVWKFLKLKKITTEKIGCDYEE